MQGGSTDGEEAVVRHRRSPSSRSATRCVSSTASRTWTTPTCLWAAGPGSITEVHKDGMYTIRWSRETLAAIHPVVKQRSEKDGTVLEEYWLGDDDLEPDPGGPLQIEQPTEITTKPLSPKDQDDRIRMVFGLTSNDPLPDVDDETLEAYHEYLSKNLTFPFRAEHGAEYGHPEPVKVIGLGDPDEEPMIDEMYGILCEARMEGHVVTLPLGELEDAKPKSAVDR